MPSHLPVAQGSVASSVLAEATEASVQDSLADGASSVDEGSVAAGIRGGRCVLRMLYMHLILLPQSHCLWAIVMRGKGTVDTCQL